MADSNKKEQENPGYATGEQGTAGVVLCGGNSTRMGSDKGLLKEEEETWAEMAVRKLRALSLPVVVSVNRQQYPVYEQLFSREQLIVDHEGFADKAPLFGLLSVHLQLPEKDLFVLACDIKDITTPLLRNLYESFKAERPKALVYHTGERPQPLCGLYTAEGLHAIYQRLQSGALKRYSMMHVLEVLQAGMLPVKEEDRPFFRNYNEPGDG